ASRDSTLRIWDAASGTIRNTLSGHTGLVTACAISPDGTWLLSASSDCTLRIWDTASGTIRHTLSDHTDWIRACAISPDGAWLLSASQDGTLKIWDVTAKACRATLRVNGALRSCLFCRDRYHIVAGGEGGIYFLRVADNG